MEIQINNLTRRYGDVRAVDNVSLTIHDGEIFFLLGPSGCGKTTLLRSLAGFESPISGEILFDGKDITHVPANLRNTAMVFQGYALWPNMTVFDNVSFGLEMQKVPKATRIQRVNEILQQLQISDLAKRKPGELSGGQQQRVALARTLVIHPGCLLLDEPLANLDTKLRCDMRQEIRHLCKEHGLTAIFVTHDRQEALSMADRLAIMQGGKLLHVGTPTEIYRQPNSAFVASFIGETNLIPATLLTCDQNQGTAMFETADGTILANWTNKQNWQPGQKCLLSLRPESFVLEQEHAQTQEQERISQNIITITTDRFDYLGELANHLGQTASGQQIKFSELNPRRVLQPGTILRLYVSPDDVAVLPLP